MHGWRQEDKLSPIFTRDWHGCGYIQGTGPARDRPTLLNACYRLASNRGSLMELEGGMRVVWWGTEM